MSVTPIRPPQPPGPPAADVRHKAMDLVLHRLRSQDQATAYDEIARLMRPDGIMSLMGVAIHLADAMAAVLKDQCGSRPAAIRSLEEQIKGN
ncbi:hypothetical protein ACFW6C_02255 [Streptomyces fungicidicus]|uniref:hypothetical protein n=1 Tax=Streptomyces fungicidicus TaxID=68203 RepID=UPI0036B32923